MRHLDLLGQDLKCEFLTDLFETYDVDVKYSYDRLHEGMADEYHAAIPDLGLQFIFDQGQKLRTLFIEPIEVDSYNPLAGLNESFELFSAKAEALQFTSKNKAEDKSCGAKESNNC